jgi:hypothetical protein
MATLLQPAAGSRKDLFDELQKLYRVRSALVHGSKEPDRRTAHAHRIRATKLGVESIKRLHARPAVLNAENSGARGRMLLLGA